MQTRRFPHRSPATLAITAVLALAPVSIFAQSNGGTASQGTQSQQPATTAPASGQTSTAGQSAGSVPLPAPDAKPAGSPQNPDQTPDQSTAPSASSPAPAGSTGASGDSTMPGVKKGSINDVNSVGTRDIGGRGMGNWYSTESEIKMGKQYAAMIEKSTKFITDPQVTEYVNRVGQNIVKNSDCKVPFTIKVIDSDEINAMALPGGFFYVNSGLILAADEEAELAGVMAHETAHVCAHHAAREMTRANYAQLGTIPLIFIGGWAGYGIYEAANLAIPLTFLQFSREFEAQADYLGLEYMYRAGYDPQAFVTFFEKIQDLQKHKPGAVARAFSDHPQTPDRIAHSQEEIAKILPPRDEYLVTTSEFDDVKARLARIENKRKLTDKNNSQKPTLRRVSNNPDPNNPSSTTDDRPTLHRRDDSGTPTTGGSGSSTPNSNLKPGSLD
ncbi:MAG TPA: M48 family metallopeptidase [Silvibacterium sp.]|nr:M48 family metallopeptidase [Silvibacterium sp.]